jgi:hypothetical protein
MGETCGLVSKPVQFVMDFQENDRNTNSRRQDTY